MAMVRMDAHIAYVTMYKASSTKKESASPLRERFAGVESQQQGDDRSDKTPDRPLGGCRIRERAYGQRCEHVNDGAGIR